MRFAIVLALFALAAAAPVPTRPAPGSGRGSVGYTTAGPGSAGPASSSGWTSNKLEKRPFELSRRHRLGLLREDVWEDCFLFFSFGNAAASATC